ncbi:MAG: putative T7SS-secreted protein [Acidimicrobiales bacterium]
MGFLDDAVALNALLEADPGGVSQLAQHLEGIADAIDRSNAQLKAVNAGTFWEGDAAAAFEELKSELPPLIEVVRTRYQEAGGALRAFVEPLRDAQDRARQALRDKEQAEEDLARAERGVDDTESHGRAETNRARAFNESHPDAPPYDPQPYPGPNWYGIRDDARDRLADAERRLEQAVRDYQAASGDTASRIRDAADDSIRNEGLFGDFGSIFGIDIGDIIGLLTEGWGAVGRLLRFVNIARVLGGGEVLTIAGRALAVLLRNPALASGLSRGLGALGAGFATVRDIAHLIELGNPIEAFQRDPAGYSSDLAQTAFDAAALAFFIAPNPVTAVIAGVAGVVWAGTEIWDNWDTISSAISDGWEAARDGFEAVGVFAGQAAEAAGDFAGDVVDGAADVAGDVVEGAGDLIEGAGDVAGDVLEGAGDFVGGLIG